MIRSASFSAKSPASFCCWLSLLIGMLLPLFEAAAEQSNSVPSEMSGPAAVDSARLGAADREPGNWMSHGRTYSEQRFSPLTPINTDTVSRLRLAWLVDLNTRRGQEATPLVVDGVMYVSTAWSKVIALNASTGKELWHYNPKVPPEWAVYACCDVVNRGVAVWRGKVFVGTLDGRLIALDAATGKKIWDVLTIDRRLPYTITGAPRVVKGKVLIGNGGAEFGVRGYITAYDAETGKQVWRFYTVPGNPSLGFEVAVLEKAVKTWTGEWWKLGGGDTVWDSMAYDPDLDLLYFGTGNGAPWNQGIRSPGGGDNLFLSSIVAVRPDTGEYVWHYQTTPGDSWDYTATQSLILADLTIDGEPRKVIMQAPKNGFFYILDRATGKLLSAIPYGPMNWASGVDMATGRPVLNPEAKYWKTAAPWLALPGPLGAHNWQSMSFSPVTGLVYIPTLQIGYPYIADQAFAPVPKRLNMGVDLAAAAMPTDPDALAAIKAGTKGHLIAWDPVQGRKVWAADLRGPWNGGTLVTAGGLVFQGDSGGEFASYAADTGAKLWSDRCRRA